MSTLQEAAMERINWENDPRVRAAGRDDFFKAINTSKMQLLVVLEDEEGCEIDHWLPFKYEVCGLCNGKGSHVNPNIDSGGLSREDFDEDPDFAESYMNGEYDVACNHCGGNKVYPELHTERFTPEQKVVLKEIEARQRAEAEYQAECRAERMMGA